MFLTSRSHVVATMALVLSLSSCADTEFVIRPPAPERFPPAEMPPSQITESIITVPVRHGSFRLSPCRKRSERDR
jgi:hypothetical protein